MIIWFALAAFLGLIIVAIWYDKIIPPISRSFAGVKRPVGEPTTKAAGPADAEIPIIGTEAFPADTEFSRVQKHFNDFVAGKRSLGRNLILLAVSIYAFIQLGVISNSLSTILIVVVVLLIHELGHFVGMKIFGYRNVHIFFIPLFGAATSGIETNPSGARKAIVSLLGPLPGILIGITLGVLYFVTRNEMLVQPAWIFMFINALNLLPLFPLDGGRFLESLFSSKNFRLEMTFKIISALLVAFIWFVLVGPAHFLFGIGTIFVLLIISIAGSFSMASTVRSVADRFSIDSDLRPNHIPLEHMYAIYDLLKSKLVFGNSPKALARRIYYVWQRLLNKPPGKKMVAGLTIVYLFSLVLAIGAPVIFKSGLMLANIERKIEIQKSPTGVETKREVMYLGGKLFGFRTLDENNLYHGPTELFDPQTNKISKAGQYYHGKWHGECKDYDDKGNIIRVVTFDKGRFISCREMTPSGWVEKKISDLAPQMKKAYEQHEKDPPQGFKN